MARAIILIDHGSRRESANAALDAVAALVCERGVRDEPSLIVRIAHMEIAEPTLEQAVTSAIEAGADSIVVHPYFLASGRHVSEDIPRLVDECRELHPGVSIRITQPLGLHPLIAEVVLERAR